MKGTRPYVAAALWFFASTASAGGFELSFFLGWTAPTFEQRFQWDPNISLPAFPGINIQQEGIFELKARGDFAFGGSATYYFNEHIGIEGRIDTVGFDIDTVAPTFTATLDLPTPLPPIGAQLNLGQGAIEIERLFPFSLNVRARTGGRVRFAASGGLSYLPKLRATGRQTVGLGVTGLGNFQQLDIAAIEIGVEAVPDEKGEGRLGFNLGLGLEAQISDRLALVFDLRAFYFDTVTLQWTRLSAPTTEIEELLLEELEQELEPIEFEPIWFQAMVGIVVRF